MLETAKGKAQITCVSGINFITDERGQKTAVIIDLKQHKALWEDLYDAVLVHARKREPRETLAAVRQQLNRKRSARG